MTDIDTTAAPAAPPAPAPTAAPPVATPPPAPAAPAPAAPPAADVSPSPGVPAAPTPMSDSDFDAQLETFEAAAQDNPAALAEARKLRSEVRRYREQSAPLRTAFAGLDDGTTGAVLALAQTLKGDNPQATIDWLKGSLEGITGQKFQAVDASPEAPAEAPTVDLSDPVAVKAFIDEQVKAGLTQHEQTQAEAQAIEREKQAIGDKLTELGYQDHTSDEAMLVMFRAKAIGGDPLVALGQAHEARQAALQNPATPPTPTSTAPGLPTEDSPAGTTPDDKHTQPRSLKEMSQAASQRIAGAFASPEFDR